MLECAALLRALHWSAFIVKRYYYTNQGVANGYRRYFTEAVPTTFEVIGCSIEGVIDSESLQVANNKQMMVVMMREYLEILTC